ncbi:hypothetical protein GGF43_005889 [Coemansia sp. RSA 2618]|nr:hypothetical protein GGF43_005889 [Coemansia sp. RSA 2618]
MTIPALETALMTKIPLWQVVLLGGTTLIAGRFLRQSLRVYASSRALHMSSPAAGAKNGKSKGKHSDPVSLSPGEDMKLVLIVRADLGMSKGKTAAQCSHAALACYKQASKKVPAMVSTWEQMGQSKVVLKCAGEEELLQLQRAARAAGLVAQSICDAGRTQIAAGSRTVLGIGPAPAGLVDSVAGHLRLY